MAHYAFLDENNIVTQVIVGKNENEDNIDWEKYYGDFANKTCKRTSYNTVAGVHWTQTENGKIISLDQSKAFRKNYAGIGFKYDQQRDAFIPPQPYASWILNEQTCVWDPPIAPPPNDELSWSWIWDESSLSWIRSNNRTS